jgi:predicted AAA+ superfamily ATPase
MKRYIEAKVASDLQKKMVFIGGPRQVGKTYLAKELMKGWQDSLYLNYDNIQHRQRIRSQEWHPGNQLLVFDELHKMPKWKSWVKGIYDVEGDLHRILVTGSSRLDVYRKGGDSLLGRYHYWRLHPFSLDEYPENLSFENAVARLMEVGGFPEPFLTMDQRESSRWRKDRFDRVLTEDLRGLELVRDLASLQVLVDLLRERVSSTLASANLAADLEVSPKSVTRWIELLEKMYVCFSIYPYAAKNLTRSLSKPPKVYFYDNADVLGDQGARLENMVATSLLKRLHWLEDYEGRRCALHYLRDKDGRECDFLTVIDKKPDLCLEVKLQDKEISKHLKYYAERLKPRRAIQLVLKLDHPYQKDGIEVMSLQHFFQKEEPAPFNEKL